MGVAALWIMLFHSTVVIPIKGIELFLKLGYLGVDIFMFMSGFSMFRSYKNNGYDKKRFWLRRLKKILPSFVVFSIIYWIDFFVLNYDSLCSGLGTAKEILMQIITYRWFVPCILLCYLITPMIESTFSKFGGFKSQTLLILVAISLLIAVPFVWIRSSVALMILIRVPEYIIGYYYGSCIDKKEKLICRCGLISVVLILYVFLMNRYDHIFLCDTGLYWWPAVIIASSMTVCISKCKVINNHFFNYLGRYSFELYLWHYFILCKMAALFSNLGMSFDKYGLIVNLIVIMLTCLFVHPYTRLVKILVDRMGA